MQRKIMHFFLNWCWWDPWDAGVPLVTQFAFPCFCKFIAQKKDQLRFTYCKQPK